jgi:hypothetical protein
MLFVYNSVIKKIEIFLQRKYFNKKEEMSKFSESEIQFCNDIYWVLENSFDEKESIEITKTLTYKAETYGFRTFPFFWERNYGKKID